MIINAHAENDQWQFKLLAKKKAHYSVLILQLRGAEMGERLQT